MLRSNKEQRTDDGQTATAMWIDDRNGAKWAWALEVNVNGGH